MKKYISFLCLLALMLGALSLYSCERSDGSADTENAESGFNTDEWTGDVELPAAEATAVPENYVVPVRLEGESDDSPAIKRALDSIKETGGTIYFCESSYTISEPIVIYKNISYVGRGVGQTTITVKAGANCDAFVTHMFDSYCDQKNYGKTVSAYFGPNSELPQNFEIKGLTIDGNAGFQCINTTDNVYKPTKNTKGSGIKIFGKRYIIENVQIQNCAEIGLYTEFNSSEMTDVDSSFNYFICSKIDGLRVISTGEEGIIYRGPSDQEVDGIWVCSSCLTGKSTVYKDRSGWQLAAVIFESSDSSNGNTKYAASIELDFAHIWRGFNSWGMVLVGQVRFKADHVLIESTNGGLKTSKTSFSQISMLDIHNCMFGDDSRAYLEINSTDYTLISNLEIRKSTDGTKKDAVLINGDNVTIGVCEMRGNSDRVGESKAGGHGIVIKGSYNQIGSFNATRLAGKGVDGKAASAIVIGTGATRNNVTGAVSYCPVAATVENGNNTLSLTTRTDTSKGQIAISASDSVIASLALTVLDYNATTKAWTKYPTQVSKSSCIDATTTEVQTITVAHGSAVKPTLAKIQITLLNNSGIGDFALAYVTVVSVDETNVTLKVKLSEASATPSAKLGVAIGIN